MDSSKVVKFLITEAKLESWHEALLDGQNQNNGIGFDFKRVSDITPMNDIQAGDIFYNKLCVFLSFIPGGQKWYAWDGRIHVPCTDDTVVRGLVEVFYKELTATLDIVDGIITETLRTMKSTGSGDDDENVKKMKRNKDLFKKSRAYAERIGNSSGIDSLVKALKTKLSVSDDYFDNDQRYLVVRNCVFDLDIIRNNGGDLDKEGVTLLHNPSRPVTRYLDVDFNPSLDYVNSEWENYLLSSIRDNDVSTVNYLKKVTGAAFMGDHGLRTIINIVGPPGSGKSLFLGTFEKMGRHGSGYSASPNSTAITKAQGTNFEQNDFKLRRFIMVSEPPMGDEIDNEFLKKFTGDASINTRTLNVAGSNWTPQGTLFIASNDTLRINSRDSAIVERMQVIKFPYKFKSNPTEPDEKLINNKLEGIFENNETEKSRILNWMLEGMSAFIDGGRLLDPPESIKKERAKVTASGTASLRWINEVLENKTFADITKTKVDFEVNDGAYTPVDEAYRVFKLWCADTGERTTPKRFFTHDLHKKFPEMSYNGKKLFKGLVKTTSGPSPQSNNEPTMFGQKTF